tara:strand:- start:154 stop:642 length:489 start_codon:yes stop_codon:yes gene_type:complete
MARLTKWGGGTGADLTVRVTESITLNERDYGGFNEFTISGIKNISRRIETITTNETTLFTAGIGVAGGTWVAANVAYIRFTNLDDTNFVILTFANAHNDEFAVKLDAGKTFMLQADNSGGMVAVFDAKDLGGLIMGLNNLKSITADADTASVDLEMYVASTG